MSRSIEWMRVGVATAFVLFAGCSEPPTGRDAPAGPDAPTGPDAGGRIGVVATDTARSATPSSFAAQVGFADVSFVSLPPGSVPGGAVALIRNRRTGAVVSASMVDGGFDPVGVAARVGDLLLTQVLGATGDSLASAGTAVPANSRPRPVRTIPPRGKTDVPVNARMSVVFSEPIDPSTVTASSVRLLVAGVPVAGQVGVEGPDNLRATFTPAEPLAPSTEYELVVTTAIRDLDGEALDAAFGVLFTTEPPAAPTAQLAFTMQPLRMGAGLAITPHVRVTALDLSGAHDSTFANLITITLEGGPAGALSGTTTVRAVAGVASFGDLRISTVGTGYALVASASSAVAATSAPFDIVPAETAPGRIAFSAGYVNPDRIYVVNADGTALTQLAGGAGHGQPDWSPDGAKLAFAAYDGSIPEIHVMNADGSGATNVTNHPAFDYAPAWSPDGTKIAFVSDRDGAWGIFVMDPDGGGVTRLTTEEAPIGDLYGGDGGPIWSPDGTRILFQRFTAQEQALYVMGADGSGIALLARNSFCSPWAAPAWSPDGTRIALGCRDITVVAADGSGRTAVTPLGSGAWGSASWSPGGTMIAFSRFVPVCAGCGGYIELHVMNADGSNPRPLVRGLDIGGLNAYQAAWSPR